MSQRQFPEPFADLESLAAWALATEAQRARKRRDSTMAEIGRSMMRSCLAWRQSLTI